VISAGPSGAAVAVCTLPARSVARAENAITPVGSPASTVKKACHDCPLPTTETRDAAIPVKVTCSEVMASRAT
jgi:hypothetical protein